MLRLEHQKALESLEVARAQAEGVHREALKGFQERLDEKRRMISSYSIEIQQLRQQLGEQATATQAAATRSVLREKELREQLQTRERELQEQLKAASEANAAYCPQGRAGHRPEQSPPTRRGELGEGVKDHKATGRTQESEG